MAILLTLCATSCQSVPRATSPNPAVPLPAYAGRSRMLFDDGIDAQGLGYSLGVSSEEHALLRERTQTGDAVVRARMVSVTSTRDDWGPGWQLGLHTLEKLAGGESLGPDFTLQVDGSDPAATVVQVFGARLLNVPFVAFTREFAAKDGIAGERHFHLATEASNEVDAVRIAAMTADVR